VSKDNVRRLFIAVLAILPLQYGLVGLTGLLGWMEPWPAVVLPGFKGVADRLEHFELQQAVLEAYFTDSTTTYVPVNDLFESIPSSHHLGVLRRQFRPASMSGTSETEQALHPEIRSWLSDRLARLYPERTTERLDVVWFQIRFSPTGVLSDATPIDTLRLPL